MQKVSLLQGVAVGVAVFVLAACHSSKPVGAGSPMMAKATTKPADVTPSNLAMGDSLFNKGNCQRCHGLSGVGGTGAPALDGQKWLQLKTGSYDEIVSIVTTGVPAANIKDPAHKNPMGARGGRAALTDPQIKAVAAYVWTLSHK